jgi:mannose-6-phosphate isomerase
MDLVPAGETPKTEAWVVLEAGAESRIYAGLKPGTTPDNLLQAIANGKVADRLSSFTPKAGDAVFIPAGTVHTLGDNVVVFEIQQNSDVTFRLYDWGHVDAQTGKPRELQVDQAISCIDFKNGSAARVSPMVEARTPVDRERLFNCDFFRLWRLHGESPFNVGATGELRVLVCLEGMGHVEYNGSRHEVCKGEVWLLPAAVGACTFHTQSTVTLLEIAIPK